MLLFLSDRLCPRIQLHEVTELPVPGCNLQDLHFMFLIIWDTIEFYFFHVNTDIFSRGDAIIENGG